MSSNVRLGAELFSSIGLAFSKVILHVLRQGAQSPSPSSDGPDIVPLNALLTIIEDRSEDGIRINCRTIPPPVMELFLTFENGNGCPFANTVHHLQISLTNRHLSVHESWNNFASFCVFNRVYSYSLNVEHRPVKESNRSIVFQKSLFLLNIEQLRVREYNHINYS